MGGPNLEVLKFGIYIMFPIGVRVAWKDTSREDSNVNR
jgi:hypothetical protein